MGDGRRPRLVVADLGGTLVNERGLVQGAIRRALGEADGDGDRPYLTTLAMERGGVTDRLAVANIGDTAHDLAAGRRAGVGWNIAVLTGRGARENLDAQPGEYVLPSFAAAVDLLLAT